MTLSIRHNCVAILTLLFMLGGSSGKPGDSPEATYRSTVSEVRLTFFAADDNHRSMEVRNDDFAVVDNEMIIRKFRSFTRSKDIKLDVVVLVDRSASVYSRFKTEIAQVLQLISQTHWIADDRLSIISFGQQGPRVICARDCQPSTAIEQVSNDGAAGLTPLFDTLQFASAFVGEQHAADVRPVIILFSDGEDTISRSDAHDTSWKLRSSEAQIYAVDLNPHAKSTDGAATLRALAEATGGKYFSIQDGAPEILTAMLDDLHNGYTVTYALPDRAAGFHGIRILPTHNLTLQFRCRDGYNYSEQ